MYGCLTTLLAIYILNYEGAAQSWRLSTSGSALWSMFHCSRVRRKLLGINFWEGGAWRNLSQVESNQN